MLPELPRIQNVRVTQRGDTAIIDFEPVAGARDYRIYPEPARRRLADRRGGEVGVKNAIYRCAGDRLFRDRKDDRRGCFDCVAHRRRQHAPRLRAHGGRVDARLRLPDAGRRTAQPVYRVADPNGGGGFRTPTGSRRCTARPTAPTTSSATPSATRCSARAGATTASRSTVHDGGTRPSTAVSTRPADWQGADVVFFFTDGPEYDARADEPADGRSQDFGERFKILADAGAGQRPAAPRALHAAAFDVLAAGEARFQRVLDQGNQPIWSLTWPGLTEKPTRFVIEALDAGCPFPGGYVAAMHARRRRPHQQEPSTSVDHARRGAPADSGEVFINGQHDPANRPEADRARLRRRRRREAEPQMDLFESLRPGDGWGSRSEVATTATTASLYRNATGRSTSPAAPTNLTVGPMLGQFVLGFADWRVELQHQHRARAR